MRSKREIRDEVIKELKDRGVFEKFTPIQIEREVDGRFHWERVIAEAEEEQKEHGEVRIEFIASPGDEFCRMCWEMNGKSLSLDELKKMKNKWACRCALVLPEKE
ncbi:hypothetical protein TRIP_C10055 [Candidatus Zixiibacteriota bacterium]|nr:hypothetical protein TRIP_C10055 [candidate division Zixibacteria bacterium]